MFDLQDWEEKGCGRTGIDISVGSFGEAYETAEPRRMMTEFFAARACAQAKSSK